MILTFLKAISRLLNPSLSSVTLVLSWLISVWPSSFINLETSDGWKTASLALKRANNHDGGHDRGGVTPEPRGTITYLSEISRMLSLTPRCVSMSCLVLRCHSISSSSLPSDPTCRPFSSTAFFCLCNHANMPSRESYGIKVNSRLFCVISFWRLLP